MPHPPLHNECIGCAAGGASASDDEDEDDDDDEEEEEEDDDNIRTAEPVPCVLWPSRRANSNLFSLPVRQTPTSWRRRRRRRNQCQDAACAV